MEYKFLFSVVIPVYNTEKYLAETIESVLGQSIGFEGNIEIILVNNATQDNSGIICEYYQTMYPYNIQYIVLNENRGPSGARNAGKAYARGKYINFLDSDDKWDSNAFQIAFTYLEAYEDEIDIVACRIRHFDAKNDWHLLDYKFGTDHVSNIFIDYHCVQLNLCSIFIRHDAIKNIALDENIKHAEDAKFLTEVIIKKKKYALLRSAVFYYRARRDDSSLLQSTKFSMEWYFRTPIDCYKEIIINAQRELNKNIYYAQYLVAYDLQWRVKTPIPDFFTFEDVAKYKACLREVLKYIDDCIILEQRYISALDKVYFLQLKYGAKFDEMQSIRHGWYCVGNCNIIRLERGNRVQIYSLFVQGSCLKIKGRVHLPFASNQFEVFLYQDDTPLCRLVLNPANVSSHCSPMGVPAFLTMEFSAQVPLGRQVKFNFMLSYQHYLVPLGIECTQFSKLTNLYPSFYYAVDHYLIFLKDHSFYIQETTDGCVFRREIHLWKEIERRNGYKIVAYRIIAFLLQKWKSHTKPLWLVSDRMMSARDNGFVLFKYLCQNASKDIDLRFVIRKDSPDYVKVRQISKTISPSSKLYKLYYLKAARLITAYLDNQSIYPFSPSDQFIRNFLPNNLVYLQHGVIKDDFSNDQNCCQKNIQRFITSAQKERDSILHNPYGYAPEEVVLTGLARYDNIISLPEHPTDKIFLLAPTWRSKMEGNRWNGELGRCDYNVLFKQSAYFQFYNSLISDSRILTLMERHGYRGVLQLHPVIRVQTSDFNFNTLFSAYDESETYENMVSKTKLLVTDYSSIAFDYAYARRSVIYVQFDKDTFYSMQGYDEGYFDYEWDGFGPVVYDYESTVQAIIDAIESGCVMEEKYRKRVDEFFAYHDGKNCERIYQEILNMDKERGE